MLTRENIREKLLDLPYQQVAFVCNAMVEQRKDGSYNITLPNGTLLPRQTMREATSAIFASQKAPDTQVTSNASPAKP